MRDGAYDWNPRDPEVLADQVDAYDAMRERCPVARSESMGWSLFRHADVLDVIRDPETFSNSSRHHAIPNALDEPEHTPYRTALESLFSADSMDRLADPCREIAVDVIEQLRTGAVIDAMAEIAEPITLRSLCAFLGWDPTTWPAIQRWLHGNMEASFLRDRPRSKALAEEIATMVSGEVARHRAGDFNDVTTELMTIEVEGDWFDEEDILATLRTWIAGHGTVAAGIGNVIARLGADHDLQQQLRKRPDLIPAAIEEILRTDGPLVSNRRTAVSDVRIEDREITTGDRISLMWVAANRDERAFDQPEAVDLDRHDGENLLFGSGIHYCLGAPLARLEMRIAIEVLLDRTAEITIDDTRPPARQTFPGNGYVDLPIQIG